MLDPRRLQVFRSVMATGSVSAAAKALGYTPSSVSQQMTVLQRELGVALFEPAGRGIRPTAAARVLDEQASAVFAALTSAEQALDDHRAGRTARLRIEYFSTAGRPIVAPAVSAFGVDRPEVQVELRLQPDSDGAPQRVLDGRVDVALHVAPGPDSVSGLAWTHLLDDEFVALLPDSHRLAGRERVGLSELQADPWVSHEWPLGCCSQEMLDACAAQGFRPSFRVEADDALTSQRLIAASMGVGVIPGLAATGLEASVVTVRLDEPAPKRRVWALHMTENAGAAAWVRHACEATAAI